MALLHLKKRQPSLTDLTASSSLNATRKQENLFEMDDPALEVDLTEEMKQAMEMLNEAMNWVCHI